MSRIENAIISNLIYNEEYCRRVVPHLKPEYFSDIKEATVVALILDFFAKYNKPASKEVLNIEVGNVKGLTDKEVPEIQELINNIDEPDNNERWIIDSTEKFCKDKAVVNAIIKCIQITDGRDKSVSPDAIPSILSEALAVCFDNNIGHDYIMNAEDRYDFYHRKEKLLEFDLELFNKITGGGLPSKTLNILLAPTGVGKSLFMCHFSAAALKQGKNVLYITLEMSEEKISERIDVNLLNLTMSELKTVDKETFMNKINRLSKKTQGKLIVKEYPTSSAHAGHFRALLEDLKIKREFIPDLICIDYLNICASQRVKSSQANSYTIMKSIAEELRGLAVEYEVPLITATQSNRNGNSNSDLGIEDTSESFGVPMSADLMLAIISTEELESMNQILIKQLKNRYNDPSYYKKFVIGIDRSRMKLFDTEQIAQEDISDAGNRDEDIPLFDKGNFGSRMKTEGFDFKF